MPISFGNGGGRPYIRFGAASNAWMRPGDGGPEEFDPKMSGMLIDVERLQMGWLHLAEGTRDWHAWPAINTRTKQPSPDHKVGFSVNVFAPKLLGEEVHEFSQNSAAATGFMQALYNKAEQGFGQGKVPLVQITGSRPIKVGKGNTREILFEITKWVDRPAKLDEAAAAAPAEAAAEEKPATKAEPAKQLVDADEF